MEASAGIPRGIELMDSAHPRAGVVAPLHIMRCDVPERDVARAKLIVHERIPGKSKHRAAAIRGVVRIRLQYRTRRYRRKHARIRVLRRLRKLCDYAEVIVGAMDIVRLPDARYSAEVVDADHVRASLNQIGRA